MIIVEGMIGSGKSTLSKLLANNLSMNVLYEPVEENPILEKYYYNMERYGFSLQIYFLSERFRMMKEARKNGNTILDRSIDGDLIFTEINNEDGNIADEELLIYKNLLQNMKESLEDIESEEKDLMVYLYAPFTAILHRIRGRGREYEQPNDTNGLLSYYKRLYDKYERFISEYDKPKIIIDTTTIDFVRNVSDENKVTATIKSAYDELNNV